MSLKKYQHITSLKKAREQGFTIVELLIVIIVIAILAALVITAYSGVQQRARESAARQKAGEIEKALIAYNVEHGGWPSDADDLNNSSNSVRIDSDSVNLSTNPMDTSRPLFMACSNGAIISYLSAGVTISDPGGTANLFIDNAKYFGDDVIDITSFGTACPPEDP